MGLARLMTTPQISPDLQVLLAATIVTYVAIMYAVSFWARGQIKDNTDFLVAGRRLPLSLAWATLLATWFGAGTLLTAADEVRREGLQRAALDPFGAGFCLILAGLFFAAPLWRMGLLTVSDFFRRKFGPRAEVVSAGILIPGYFGWIAAQFVALAGMLELFFGIDPVYGIFLVAVVGMGYTLMGGMWSVTLTDAIQIVCVLAGLIVLGWAALQELGLGSWTHGLSLLLQDTPAEMLRPWPAESLSKFMNWLAIFAIGALGNIPGQDLLQRIFAAKSAVVARRACWVAGVGYLSFGLVPLLLGLVANLLFPQEMDTAILPALAHAFLHPAVAVIFTVTLMSAVLSTIDSAILSPAGVLAQNILEKINKGRHSLLVLNRWSVVFITGASLVMAYLGESAYSLLEDAYELPLVSLFIPLVLGLFVQPRGEKPAVFSMLAGSGLWLMHYIFGWDYFHIPGLIPLAWQLPGSLMMTAISLVVYLAVYYWPLPAAGRR